MKKLREEIQGQKLYDKYFGLDNNDVTEYLSEHTTIDEILEMFDEAKTNHDSVAFRCMFKLVFKMAMKYFWVFIGPDAAQRARRIRNGDFDAYLSLCVSAMSDTLDAFDPAQYDTPAAIVRGLQFYFRGYVKAETERENRSRARAGDDYFIEKTPDGDDVEPQVKITHPDQVEGTSEKSNVTAWEKIGGEGADSFADVDYTLKQNFERLAQDPMLRNNKWPWNLILADALSGDSIEDIAKKYDCAKNTIRYKLYGSDGIAAKLAKKYSIELTDLAKLMQEEPTFIKKALA